MEKLKSKHDHKWTDRLKVILFSLVMMAPLFAILTECLMVIQNEQALTDYTGTPAHAFYNAVDYLSTSTLFAWTTSTGIYSTLLAMCTGLELGTGATAICVLLTYWSLMTAIYIVFDIIIFCFTKLTHLIQ